MGVLEQRSEMWAGKDSNLRRRKPTDLQSVVFDHFTTYPKTFFQKTTSWRSDLNRRPAVYKTAALPLSYSSKRVGLIGP